jgi:P pilus assembly chaperone PapD
MSFAFKLSPDCFDKRIDGRGSSEEITFWNDSMNTVRYKIYIDKGDTKSDMSKWVEIYPKVLTIKPKSSGKVRVFAQAPAGAPKGEYNFYLGARSMAIPLTEEKSTQLALPINLKIKMYGYNGDFTPTVDLKNYQFTNKNGKLHFKGTLVNSTENVSIKSQVVLVGSKNKEMFTTGRIRKGSFNFDIPLDDFKNPKDIKEILLIDEMSNKELKKIKTI